MDNDNTNTPYWEYFFEVIYQNILIIYSVYKKCYN